jgi:hypothetical protein
MTAVPRLITRQPVRLWQGRHPPQCQDSVPCSRSSYALPEIVPLASCLYGGRCRVPVFNAFSHHVSSVPWRHPQCMFPPPLKMVAEEVGDTGQGTASRGGWRRVSSAKGSWLRCTYALAAAAATKIKFQLLVDTALGMTTNACAASRTSPNCCWPALGIPGRSQFGLGTAAG